jgi:hypothetical protein
MIALIGLTIVRKHVTIVKNDAFKLAESSDIPAYRMNGDYSFLYFVLILVTSY